MVNESPDPPHVGPVPPSEKCNCEHPAIFYRGYAVYCGKCGKDYVDPATTT